MSTPAPRKRLPVNPSAEHLRKQAKRLHKQQPDRSLAEAQHELAAQYGCRSWPELMHIIETMSRGAQQLSGYKIQFEPLPAAANRSDLAEVRRILENDSFTQHDLDLALARAVLAFSRRADIARLLVEYGADVDGQYGSNYGPIVFVTGECLDPDGLQFLIDNGADVTFEPIASKYGTASPMISTLKAYIRGHNQQKHRCIDILLRHGAHVPPEFGGPLLAIHRGDASELARLLDAQPALLHQRFSQIPFGNLALDGATLLHAALELGELDCAKLLVARGADVNARAQVIDGLGGQTPIFHTIAAPGGGNLPALQWLLDEAGRWVDLTVRATFSWLGEPVRTPTTPLEFAQSAHPGASAPELALLRRMQRPRTDDPAFAAAVDAIDSGNLPALCQLLAQNPSLATARAQEAGSFAGPYFARPALLWFIAENPRRTGKLAPNICELADAIIQAGTSQADIDYTAGLVASGDVPRDSGQLPALLELLARRGADLSAALTSAVQERQRDAIAVLLRLGARPSLPAAAGLGDLDALRRGLAAKPDSKALQAALYNAAVNGQSAAVETLVREGGLDPNTRIGLGTTALHLAAWNGSAELVEALLKLGADPTIQDAQYGSTPAGWAQHNSKPDLAQRLRKAENPA